MINSMWLEIAIERYANDVRVSAHGSRDERIASRSLGWDVTSLLRFAASVQRAATYGRPLDEATRREAQSLHRALLGDDIGRLVASLGEAGNGPLLVRIAVSDAHLQAVPWEALCAPEEAAGFLATSPRLLPTRGVTSRMPAIQCNVSGPVRVLAIAPTENFGGETLKHAQSDQIARRQIEWLEPIVGSAASPTVLFDRLRRGPISHILHFIGHGAITSMGSAALRLADDEENEERWVVVEVLAQQLESVFRGYLRLVVLESCGGAKPSEFASGAEILVRAGVVAVVAYLWPIRAAAARKFSTELYRILTSGNNRGDIALAMNEARRVILADTEMSAEAFSPVLYLRGTETVIFDFNDAPTIDVSTLANVAAPSSERIADADNDIFSDFAAVASAIRNLLAENRALFNAFGPMSESANADPASNLYEVWRQCREEKIVPNNQKIVRILDANQKLLPGRVLVAFAQFKVHAIAYEHHVKNPLDRYPTFPAEFAEVFEEHE